MQKLMYKTKIYDIYDLQERFTQTWVDFEQKVIQAIRLTSGATVTCRSCMRAGGGHFEHVLRNYCLFVLCGSSEHFMKLSM